jgi:restriction system protein
LAGACRECQLPKERKELEHKAYLAEQQRKAEIQRQAEALRTQEIQRLSHAWLSRSESYYSMSPQQFEDAIAQLFRNLGYQVKQTPYSGDGGKDAILVKDGTKYVVECKRYGEANCIGRPDLQKFFAAMHHEGAVGAFYVNTGKFSPQAIEYAKTWPVTLYDRDTFPSLVTKAYPVPEPARFAKTICLKCGEIVELPVQESKTSLLCPAGHPVESTISLPDLGVFTSGVPYCKKCGSPMRIRKGYRGKFLGCSRYPKCRFTMRSHRGRPEIVAKSPSPIEMK